MVRASHRRSEGCGFDSRVGLRNIFLSLRLSLSSKQLTFNLPSCKSFHIYLLIRYTNISSCYISSALIACMNQYTSYNLLFTIWVLVAQWLERLTEGQKISGSILMFMGLRNIFLSLRLSLSSKQFTFVSQCVTRCIMAGATCLTMALQDKLHKKSHRITRHLMTTKQFIFHPHCHENQHFICIIRLVKTGRISHRYEWFVLTTFLSRTYLYIGLI